MPLPPIRILILALAIPAAPAAAPGPAWSAASAGADSSSVAALRAGLENVTVTGGAVHGIAFENRRWRHSAEALGRLRIARAPLDPDSAARAPFLAFERRLGLVTAAIRPPATPSGEAFEVRFPSDAEFPEPPRGPLRSPTFGRPDLELQPLLSYALGKIFDPVLVRLALSPRLRVNPWPGALATLALEIPVRNDFEPDPLHPDLDEVRPGQMTLDQYLWVPRAALASLSFGQFGDNRWGASVGAARPLAQGAVLLDAQADFTGFVSFGPGDVEYSTPERVTGWAAATWRAPLRDLAIRARAERYLGRDRGVDLELRRSMGDVDIGFFGQRSAGINTMGVRLAVPLPPMARAAGRPVRFQPAARWPLEHRSTSGANGQSLRGAASREELLRQLSRPALAANAERWRLGRGVRPAWLAHDSLDRVSWTGMTGFVNTPWAGVMGDRHFEGGFNLVPKRWAYDQRKLHDSHVYYVTLGFLPRVEAAIRATAFPGLRSFEDLVPESRITDTDEMASGRIVLLEPRLGRPGVAVGVEDVQGTRRFHSTYAVAGMPLRWRMLTGRVAAGFAPRILDATRHTLDGGFGALEVSPLPVVSLQLEHDSEKWNTALAVRTLLGLRLRAALLGMTHGSLGGGFHFAL